ncbi:hypothetical protein [Acinetobacter sp. P8-3-8]|uniref:hypothetical protein n=1 Tax=Acinetobacter sp. P8-3-8 TaxID=1029823 RepID=UPI0002487E54|nr:hypothetical protein [Acinetobacter sp. P8-3-8]
MKYLVKRVHFGDRMYYEGEEREANPNDVQHLLNKGVLAEFLDENKETKQVKTNQRLTKAKPE